MRVISAVLSVALTILSLPVVASGQQTPSPVVAGARVRVWSNVGNTRREGIVVHSDSAALVLGVPARRQDRQGSAAFTRVDTLPYASIPRLEVERRRGRGDKAGSAILWGAGLGLLAGAAGVALGSAQDDDDERVGGGLAGGAIGLALGVTVGVVVGLSPRWQRVSLSRHSTS